MNKQEFCNKVIDLTGDIPEISDVDYKAVEYVYTWHPCIDSNKGKDQIAYLYINFGMRIIYDMMVTAVTAEKLENQIRNAKNKLTDLTDEYNMLKKGSIPPPNL